MLRLTILFLVVVAAVVAGILALNWPVFGATAHINLVFGAFDSTIGRPDHCPDRHRQRRACGRLHHLATTASGRLPTPG